MRLAADLVRWLSNGVLRLPTPRQSSSSDEVKLTSRVLVFGKFPNPTFDYYLAARLKAPNMPQFELVDIRDFDPRLEAGNTFIVIVRYASFELSRWIARNRSELSGVALLVDDDIAAAILSPQATMSYRFRLLRHSILPLRVLDGIIDELWVSTAVLAQRLAYATPRVMEPAPDLNTVIQPEMSQRHQSSPVVRVAYHATAIHDEEHRFLMPIIQAVLDARPFVNFEVIATGKCAQEWQRLHHKRIAVKEPLPWNEYLESQTKRIEIMIVPVAPSRLNECRAETKRIDVARVGAAALFSDCPAFRPGNEGEILLPYEASAWVTGLFRLIDDAEAREAAAAATMRRVETMALGAKSGISPLSD